jgi:peptidoglycan-N-acetylglucosamine deacetylase
MSTFKGTIVSAPPLFLSAAFACFSFLACTNYTSSSSKNTDSSSHNQSFKKEATSTTSKNGHLKKKIYLTFDDGPNPGTTKVLNILEQEKVPATFFIIGEQRYYGPKETIDWNRLLANKNFVVCNHSYTHAWKNHYNRFYAHPEGVMADFKRCQDSLHFNNNISRTPGRNTWRLDSLHFTDNKKSKLAVDSLSKDGFVLMGWDVEWQFQSGTLALKTDAAYMLTQIELAFHHHTTRTPNNLVLLSHDRVFADSADAAQLTYLVQALKKNTDYELELATSYPGACK